VKYTPGDHSCSEESLRDEKWIVSMPLLTRVVWIDALGFLTLDNEPSCHPENNPTNETLKNRLMLSLCDKSEEICENV